MPPTPSSERPVLETTRITRYRPPFLGTVMTEFQKREGTGSIVIHFAQGKKMSFEVKERIDPSK